MSVEARPIRGFPRYSVNERGEVFGPRGKLKPQLTAKGYHRVCMRNNGKTKYASVHSLVLEAFVCRRPKGKQACHYNGIKTDNQVSNLRWGTCAENYQDKIRHGKDQNGERHGHHKLTANQVKEIRKAYENRTSYRWGEKSFADRFGVHRDTVYRAACGILWKKMGEKHA